MSNLPISGVIPNAIYFDEASTIDRATWDTLPVGYVQRVMGDWANVSLNVQRRPDTVLVSTELEQAAWRIINSDWLFDSAAPEPTIVVQEKSDPIWDNLI